MKQLIYLSIVILISFSTSFASESIKYIVETDKSVATASADLEAAIKKHGFGIMKVHNLKETLKKKGYELENEAIVYEICNPKYASQVLKIDISMNMALPCRISIYTENGQTKIGMVKPSALLSAMSDSKELAEIADEVENILIKVIDETK